MRQHLKIILLLITIVQGGCFKQTSSSSSKTRTSTTIEVLDYADFKDRFLLYANIFSINKENYYVYFFSKTCSHCNSLKSFILSKAKEEDIYFVESCEEIVFSEDVSSTIGLTSIDGFSILGYPTLIEIVGKTITKNLGGIPLIRSELTN